MKKRGSPLLLVLCTLLFLTPSASAEGIADITADRIEHLAQTNTYIANGSVKIVFEDTTLTADEMFLDGNTSDAVASGHVVLQDKDSVIKADKIEMNLKTKLGVVYNSNIFYKKRNFHIQSGKIKKIGDKTFYLDKASVTTCDAEVPAWSFSGRDVEITQNKSLSAWHGTFNVKDFPVLYSPYTWVPLLQDRQTGLLQPSFGYSSTRGQSYKQGFFWAIQENQDATIYLDYYSELGFAEGLDYRYALTPETHGEFWFYRARDNEPVRDLSEFKSYHNVELPYDFSGYLKVHTVSDFDYYERMDSTSLNRFGLSSWGTTNPFGFASEERWQKYLESDFQLARPFYNGRVYLLAQTRQSLEGRSNEIPQSLPEIGLVLNTLSMGDFSFNTTLKGVNFWRRDGQKGQRIDINPNLYFSYGRLINVTQKIGLRDTAYFLEGPAASENRFLYDLSTTLTTKFFKKYSSLVHLIEPSLEYAYMPSTADEDISFFDSTDSLTKTNSVNYALTNRISGSAALNLEARFRLSQSYSLFNIDKKFSPVLAEAVMSSNNVTLQLNASYDVDERRMSENIASLILRNSSGYVGVGENLREATQLDQITFETGLSNPIKFFNISLPIDVGGKIWYDLNGHNTQEYDIQGVYSHQCWRLALAYIKRITDYQIIFTIEFKGLGTIGTSSTTGMEGSKIEPIMPVGLPMEY
ncbi:MAG: LPS-assembly protein LptD [Nitrospirae bacterium]|nr:LPS-assembly protein LptD [Nitrospirota bacterium]